MSVSMGVIIAEAAGMLLCVGVPVAALIFLQIKYKRCMAPFFSGVAAFIISQLVLRSRLLNEILPQSSWYLKLVAGQGAGYWVFMGLTAGIFEETARWVCFHLLKNHRKTKDAIAFGFGHGGIEALVITGVRYLNLFICSMVIYTGGSLEALGVSTQAAEQATAQISAMSVMNVLAGGVERIAAMGIHIGCSLLVFAGVKGKKSLRYLLLAVLLHGAVDASIGLWQAFGVGGYALEGIFFIYAAVLIVLGWWCCKRNVSEEQ